MWHVLAHHRVAEKIWGNLKKIDEIIDESRAGQDTIKNLSWYMIHSFWLSWYNIHGHISFVKKHTIYIIPLPKYIDDTINTPTNIIIILW